MISKQNNTQKPTITSTHNMENNSRKLKNGQTVPQLEKAITISVYTKCPEKYLLVDLETNEVYRGSTNPDKMWTKQESTAEHQTPEQIAFDKIVKDQIHAYRKVDINAHVIQKDENSFTLSCKMKPHFDVKSFREALSKNRIFKYYSIDTGLRFPNTQGDYTHSVTYRINAPEPMSDEDKANINEFLEKFKV